MNIFDKKLRKNSFQYIFQCLIAGLTIYAILLFLDVITETAIITALGASTFIIFTMPRSYSSDPRRLLGGYAVGIAVGIFFYLISTWDNMQLSITGIGSSLVIFGAITVGIAIFIMAITNTEHAPAAGIALGLIINKWDYMTIIFIILAVIWLAGVRRLLQPYLIDLTSPE